MHLEKTPGIKEKKQIGFIPWNKGKTNVYSEDTLIKMRTQNKGKFVGKNSPNYKNPKDRISPLNKSIRNLPKIYEWKLQVRGRDNWICQKCGCKGWMEAHHIIMISKLIKKYNIKSKEDALLCDALWDLDNGITYCKKCHKLLKGKGGLL